MSDSIDDVCDRIFALRHRECNLLPCSTSFATPSLEISSKFDLLRTEDDAPLPREFNLKDLERNGLDFIIPAGPLDTPSDVLASARALSSPSGTSFPVLHTTKVLPATKASSKSQLAEFEVLEEQMTRGNDCGDARSLDEGEAEATTVLKNLELLGENISQRKELLRQQRAATRVGSDDAAVDLYTNVGKPSRGDFVIEGLYANRTVTSAGAASISNRLAGADIRSLMKYSLSNPAMKAYASQVSTRPKCHTETANAQPAAVGKEELPATIHLPAPSTSATAHEHSSAALSSQIQRQQDVLRDLLQKGHEEYLSAAADGRRELEGKIASSQAQTEQMLHKELGAVKRHQQEILRSVVQEEIVKARIGGIQKSTQPGEICIESSNPKKAQIKSDEAPPSFAVDHGTATLIVKALETEREKMEKERQVWHQAFRQQQHELSSQQLEFQRELRRMAQSQLHSSEQMATAAVQKSAIAAEAQTAKFSKSLMEQQKRLVAAVRDDQREAKAAPPTASPHQSAAAPKVPQAQLRAEVSRVVQAELKEAIERRKAERKSDGASAFSPYHSTTTTRKGKVKQGPLDVVYIDKEVQVQPPDGAHVNNVSSMRLQTVESSTSPIVSSKNKNKSEHDSERWEPFSLAVGADCREHNTNTQHDLRNAIGQDHRQAPEQELPTYLERTFIEEMVNELKDSVADRQGSTSRSDRLLPNVLILTEPRSSEAPVDSAEAALPTEQPIFSVEMCVNTFLDDEKVRAAHEKGVGVEYNRKIRRDEALLTKEEAMMLIDARKRLERIRQFTLFDSRSSTTEDAVPSIVGESAECLLLNAVTKGLIHEVVAENVRAHLKTGGKEAAEDVAVVAPLTAPPLPLLPSTGSEKIDRLLVEECLKEFLNLDKKGATEAPAQLKQEVAAVTLDELPPEFQGMMEQLILENVFMKTHVPAISLRGGAQVAPVNEVEVVRVPASSSDVNAITLPPAAPPPVVQVTVDTSGLTEAVKQLVTLIGAQQQRDVNRSNTNTTAGATASTGVVDSNALGDTMHHQHHKLPQPPCRLMEEHPRRHDVEEPLPVPSSQSIPAPMPLVPAAQLPLNNDPTPQQPVKQLLAIEDMEAVLLDRVLRRLQPFLQEHQKASLLDVSGVSSSTSSSSSSTTSTDSSDTPATLSSASPEVLHLVGAESLVRHRFYGDVDELFRLLQVAFLEEKASVAQRDQQRAPAILPQDIKPIPLPRAAETSKENNLPVVAVPVPPPPAAAPGSVMPIRDPVTALIVDWFRNVDNSAAHTSAPPVVPIPAPQPLAAPPPPQTAAPPPRLMLESSDDEMSSTNPSSFELYGIHKFQTYLPSNFVAELIAYPHRRHDDDTMTTMTTIVETSQATTETSSHVSSSSAHHRPGRPKDDTSTSQGTNTTVSSLTSEEIRRMIAENAVRAAQWPQSSRSI